MAFMSILASLSVAAEVWTMMLHPGIIFGGYLTGISRRRTAFLSLQERSDLRIIVDFYFREEGHILWIQAKSKVAGVVSCTSLDTFPVFDLGHYDVYHLAEEVIHVLAGQIAADGDICTLFGVESIPFHPVRSHFDTCDGLYRHSCYM